MKKSKYALLLLMFVFVLAFGSVAMADVVVTDKDGNEHTLPDIPSEVGNYLIRHDSFGYSLYVIDNTEFFYGGADTSLKIYGTTPTYYLTDSVWEKGGTYNTDGVQIGLVSTIIYSTVDLVNRSDGSVFFQAPKGLVLQTALRPINLGGTLSEVILLLPLVLLAIVLYLGLRKALNFVYQVLWKA